MKTTIFYKAASMLLAASALISCDDTLDVTPQDKLTPETFFKDASQLEMYTNKFYGTSKAVIAELVKHIPRFDKTESFLSNKKWVEGMISDGKLQDACARAKQFDTNGESYSNLWKAFEYLEVFTTKQ